MLSKAQITLLREIAAGGEYTVYYWGGKIMGGPDGRTLNALEQRGLIKKVGYGTMPAIYKITPAGLAALEAEGGR